MQCLIYRALHDLRSAADLQTPTARLVLTAGTEADKHTTQAWQRPRFHALYDTRDLLNMHVLHAGPSGGGMPCVVYIFTMYMTVICLGFRGSAWHCELNHASCACFCASV
jgi:hypothetical protein